MNIPPELTTLPGPGQMLSGVLDVTLARAGDASDTYRVHYRIEIRPTGRRTFRGRAWRVRPRHGTIAEEVIGATGCAFAVAIPDRKYEFLVFSASGDQEPRVAQEWSVNRALLAMAIEDASDGRHRVPEAR